LLAESEVVFGEELTDLYGPTIEWYGTPFMRIVMLPNEKWFKQQKIDTYFPKINEELLNRPLDFVPTLSLGLVPPIERHVNGPWPPHYVLELHEPNSLYGVLIADLWKDWRRAFTHLCEHLDIAVVASGSPLLSHLESSQSLEARLAKCFSRRSVFEDRSDSEDYGSSLEFGFPFTQDFQHACDAFNLMYPILSSALGYGVGDKDRMAIYIHKVSAFYGSPPPRLSNYLHEHPILKKTHVREGKRARRKPRHEP
jgi:hypothetical protein